MPIDLDHNADAGDWIKARRLTCIECGRVSREAVGWRAEVAHDPEGEDEPEVVAYCPGCWSSEFSGDQ